MVYSILVLLVYYNKYSLVKNNVYPSGVVGTMPLVMDSRLIDHPGWDPLTLTSIVMSIKLVQE